MFVTESRSRLGNRFGKRNRLTLTAAVAALSAGLLLLSGGMLSPVFADETSDADNQTELPTGDGNLKIALLLSGDKLTGDNLAALTGAELAVREINRIATKKYLGGDESQTNTVKDLTVTELQHRFLPAADAEVEAEVDAAKKLIDGLVADEIDVIITPTSADAGSIAALATDAGIPIFYADEVDNFAGTFPTGALSFKNVGTAGPIVTEIARLMAEESVTGTSYIYLPNAEGNAIRRLLEKNVTIAPPHDGKNQDSKKDTDASELVAIPLLFDDLNVENIIQQVQDERSSHVIIHASGMKSDVVLVDELVTKLRAARISTDKVFVTGVATANLKQDDVELLPDAAGLRLVNSGAAINDAFAKRLKQIDPWTSVKPVAEKVYESVIQIQLARAIAEDDNGQRILQAALEFAGNNNLCDSYDSCAFALNYTPDIHFVGASSQVHGIQIQPDNSFLVLNGSNDVK